MKKFVVFAAFFALFLVPLVVADNAIDRINEIKANNSVAIQSYIASQPKFSPAFDEALANLASFSSNHEAVLQRIANNQAEGVAAVAQISNKSYGLMRSIMLSRLYSLQNFFESLTERNVDISQELASLDAMRSRVENYSESESPEYARKFYNTFKSDWYSLKESAKYRATDFEKSRVYDNYRIVSGLADRLNNSVALLEYEGNDVSSFEAELVVIDSNLSNFNIDNFDARQTVLNLARINLELLTVSKELKLKFLKNKDVAKIDSSIIRLNATIKKYSTS